MIKILALGAHPELRAIKAQLKKENIELTVSAFSKVRLEIVNNKVDIYVKNSNIKNYDFVWINNNWTNRQLANAIAVSLSRDKIAHTEVESEKSKLVDNVSLASSGVNIPNTFYVPTDKLKTSIRNIERVCRYPVIIKITRGSLGNGIYLAKNRAELKEIIIKNLKKSKQYLCQEFIENDYDYRIIVSGMDKILSAEKRIRKDGEFRNNAYLGATEVFLSKDTLSKELVNISRRSAEALQLDWTGIDIVRSTTNKRYYVLELNRRPGLTKESSEITAAYDYILSILVDRGIYVES